jgi:hypothetical protein
VEYSYVWYWHCLMLDWYGAAWCVAFLQHHLLHKSIKERAFFNAFLH